MEQSPAPRTDAERSRDLAEMLVALRDSLMRASLFLQDYRYQIDDKLREQARVEVMTFIEKTRSTTARQQTDRPEGV